MIKHEVYLVLSIDVEEEGLFRGKYACRNAQHTNVACLNRLAPFWERGARPTFFCTHGVYTTPDALKALEVLAEKYFFEPACHLHFWNTPPIPVNSPDVLNSVPTSEQELTLLTAKLGSLAKAAADFCGCVPGSFRMGRWDLHAPHWELIREAGFSRDSSVRPLHVFASPAKGPNHYLAPCHPYWIETRAGSIFEVPATVVPLQARLPNLMRQQLWARSFRHWGALALLPVEYPLWLLKRTTLLHLRHGGKVLSLTWHSSEMMPGGTPRFPDEAGVTRFLNKMLAYFDWLPTVCQLKFLSMQELEQELGPSAPGPLFCDQDWATSKGAGA